MSEEKEGVPYGGGHWEVKGLVGGSEKRMASMRERERDYGKLMRIRVVSISRF